MVKYPGGEKSMIIKEDIKELMRRCGDIILNADRKNIGISTKEGHGNFATKYDIMVQNELKKGLAEILPEAAFYGEEEVHAGFPEERMVFVVDPIDGTTNFIKDLKWSCISIGLLENKSCVAGFIYNPYSDEMFSARKGEGAFLNNHRIRVSNQPLENAIVIFGTAAYYEDIKQNIFEKADEYMQKSIDIRRSGSAALDLCMVACGRAEMFFEYRLQPWDYAAGSLLVTEAGGTVKRTDGSPMDVTTAGSCLAYGTGISLDQV